MSVALLLEWLARYGYGAVLVAAALESLFPFGFVFPGSIIVLSSAAVSDAASLNPLWVAVLAATGETVGQVASYTIGWFAGPRAVARLSRRFPPLTEPLERGTAYFRRHGAWALVLGRAAWGVKAALPVVAGAARMPPWKAMVLFAISSAYYYPGLVLLSRLLGLRAENLTEATTVIGIIVAVFFGLTVLVAFVIARRQQASSRT